MLKMMFSPTPGWIKDVEKNGNPAQAVVLSNPQDLVKGIGGYQGRDGWIDVQVEVHPATGAVYQAKMKCRFSTALGGMLAPGLKVNVGMDPRDPSHVLLVDDVNKLLSYRLKQ